jgi:ubiquinone/menaquinone biosynthesis C-methylase UbiE
LILILGFLAFTQTILRLIRRFYPLPIPGFATQLIDNPIRRRFIQSPEIVAERMGLKPGMIVVEIGPGKGSYTKAVAEKILPDGKVYAIDIQEPVVERLKKRFEKEGITNIYPRIDNAYALSFEDESVDRVLAIATLPEIPEPVKVLRECHRILKTDGLVCLSELFPDPDYPLRRTEKRWADEAGFELKEEFGNWFIYQLNFRKKTLKLDKAGK